MSLLSEIINEAAAGDGVARLLRKCMILAHTLDSQELADWAKAELNGYGEGVTLPAYRRLSCQNKGVFIGPFNSWQQTLEIPL